MKKIIICSLVILSFFSCSRNKFTVDVEMQNANGKTAYLQRMIDNELVNIDSALIENNKAVFNVKKSDNNDAYHIYIKGWRRALPFFADNQNVVINGDFNAYHKINVTASETQKGTCQSTSPKFNISITRWTDHMPSGLPVRL